MPDVTLETLDPRILLGGAILIVVLAAVLASVPYLAPQSGPPSVNQTAVAPARIPTVDQLLASGEAFNLSTLIEASSNQVTASNWFNATYSGRVRLAINGAIGSNDLNTSVNMSISVTYMRLNGSSRTVITVENGTIFGNTSVVNIEDKNASYSCYKYWESSDELNSNYSCIGSKSGIQSSEISSLLDSIPQYTLKAAGQRTYEGMPCTLAVSSGLPSFSACISTVYNVPLNATFSMPVSKGALNITSTELITASVTSIGLPVTMNEVVSLPGPLVVQPSFNYSIGAFGNTIHLSLNGTCESNVSSGFSCKSPIVSPFSTISFTLAKTSPGAAHNLNAECAFSGFVGNATYYPVGSYGFAAANVVALSLPEGQSINVVGLECAGPGRANSTIPIGEPVSGTLYVRYTNSSGPEDNSTNPWLASEVGVFTANVI